MQKDKTERSQMIDWILNWNKDNIKDCNQEAIRKYCEEQTNEYLQEHIEFIKNHLTPKTIGIMNEENLKKAIRKHSVLGV